MPTVKIVNGKNVFSYNLLEVTKFLVDINDLATQDKHFFTDSTEEEFITQMNQQVLKNKKLPSPAQINWIERIYAR